MIIVSKGIIKPEIWIIILKACNEIYTDFLYIIQVLSSFRFKMLSMVKKDIDTAVCHVLWKLYYNMRAAVTAMPREFV